MSKELPAVQQGTASEKMCRIVRRATADTVNAWKRALSAMLPYRPLAGGRNRLDAEYSSGMWDYLGGLDELARFSVVAGYCHYLKPQGSILEIGCGEGLLQQRLDGTKYSKYVGVDISSEAIARAGAKASDKISFVAEDAAVYRPPGEFDLIVFNECLEYFAEPLAVVQRYESFLKKDGLFIVSMFVGLDTVRTRCIWRTLGAAYAVKDETRITNGKRCTWKIKAVIPPSPGHASVS